MKKLYLFSFLLVALAGCQVEELATQDTNELPESKTVTYYVGMEDDAETKTSSTSEGEILWSEGDKMNIFSGVNNDNKDKLVLVEGAGTKNGSFYGPYIATSDLSKLHQTVIVYPFDENNTCVANEDKTEYTVGLNIPAVQEYAEGSFANGAYPMIGVTENTKEVVIETKNVCPVIFFNLTGSKTISKIVLSSDELALAGPSEVVVSHDANPVATVVPETASNTVELLCDGVQLSETPTEFHIVLAPCTGVINVTIYDTEGSYTRRTLPSREYARNQRTFFTHEYTGESKIEDDIEKAFKNGGEYKLPLSVAVHPLKENVREHYVLKGGKSLHIDLCGHTLTLLNGPGGSKACIQNENASLHISNGEIVSKSSSFVFGTKNFGPNAVFELTDVNVTSTDSNGGTIMAITNATNIIFNNVNAYSKSVDLFRYRDSSYNQGSVEGDYPGESGITINGGTYKVKAGQKIFNKLAEYKLPVVFQGDCLFSENSYTGVTWAESGNEEFPWKPVGHKVFVGAKGYYSLTDAIADAKNGDTITLADGTFEGLFFIEGKSLDIVAMNEGMAVINGKLGIAASGKTVNIKGIAFENSYTGSVTTGHQYVDNTGKYCIGLYCASVNVENCTFNLSTDGGINFYAFNEPEYCTITNSTFNCNGFRPILSKANVTVDGCTFNDQYKYSLQVWGNKNSGNEKVVFTNNIINEPGKTSGCADAYKSYVSVSKSYEISNVAFEIAGNTPGYNFVYDDNAKVDITSCSLNGQQIVAEQCVAIEGITDVKEVQNFDDICVATMNGTGYVTIQAAIDASVGGETIEVAAGTYPQVLKVTGGKNFTIQPESPEAVVVIGGVDHQSNGTASTVVFNNITFDNSIQTAGWFTGTSQNLNVCVGAWGGDLSFNGCTFNVAGTSGAETGVMTWWTTDKMSLSFKECTFNGINNHASARAMQIYGNVDLTVDGCTFNTHKDYSLKYVGKEGTTAVLTNNIVNNTENFVELGSSVYPGNAYIVNITGSTLGEGINDYIVANVEEQIVNGVEYSTYLVSANGQKFETVDAALAGTTGDVEITVKEGEYVLPAGLNLTSESRTVTIKGAGKDVTNLKGSVNSNSDNPGNYANGLALKFEDITFTTANNGYNGGFGHAASVEFINCKIVGQFYAHSGAPHKFTDCTIDPLNGYLYTYASDCDFVNCDFTASQGKALQVYEDSSTGENIVNITDCSFVAAKHAFTWDGKPVTGIDINSNGSTKFVVNINNCTTSGFPTGLNSGSDLWNVKNVNGNITVFVNGENVYPGYEKVSDNEYNVYSAKGLSYFSEKTQNDVTLNIMKDIDFNDAEFKAIIVGRKKSLTIKGNNHVIKNARVVSGNEDNTTGQASFFYVYHDATLTVSDLKFENIEVDADINGTGYAGTVVGYAEGNVILTNVDVTGADVYGEKSCGALVGFIPAGGSATLTNCDVLKSYVEAKEDRTGAYAGRAVGSLTVENCTVDSEFTSVAPAGWANLYIGQRYTGCPTCTIDGKEYVDAYYGLAAAIANATDGAELIVADGTYEGHFDLTGKKNVTIEAINAEKAVINGMVWADNCTVTLKGLKLSNPDGVQHPNPSNSQYYASINSQYPVVGAYNNAKIKFDGCVFDLVGPTVYGFYGYAHNDPVFEGCTFNCNKIRPIASNGDSITVNGCTFNDQYHYSVRIFENSSERQTVVYTNNTVQGTNDKGEFEGVNISKKGSTATVYADFIVTGNTSDLKYRHHKNVTMGASCTYVGITGFEKED